MGYQKPFNVTGKKKPLIKGWRRSLSIIGRKRPHRLIENKRLCQSYAALILFWGCHVGGWLPVNIGHWWWFFLCLTGEDDDYGDCGDVGDFEDAAADDIYALRINVLYVCWKNMCLSIYLSFFLSVYFLSVYLSIYQWTKKSTYILYMYVLLCGSLCMCVSVFVCVVPSLCLSLI